MISAIRAARGFVSKAAEILGVSRQTFYVYLRRYETVQRVLEEEREKRHDFVELKLMEGIKEGNTALIIFYLKTQARHRGYVERVEHVGNRDADPIRLAISADEMSRAYRRAQQVEHALLEDNTDDDDG